MTLEFQLRDTSVLAKPYQQGLRIPSHVIPADEVVFKLSIRKDFITRSNAIGQKSKKKKKAIVAKCLKTRAHLPPQDCSASSVAGRGTRRPL